MAPRTLSSRLPTSLNASMVGTRDTMSSVLCAASVAFVRSPTCAARRGHTRGRRSCQLRGHGRGQRREAPAPRVRLGRASTGAALRRQGWGPWRDAGMAPAGGGGRRT
eukprot:7116474-Prymnesium_polylepis.1